MLNVSWKSGFGMCQNQATSPYFDQLSESSRLLCPPDMNFVYKNTQDRILGKRNVLHTIFTITTSQHKCIFITNNVFKSKWIRKFWGLLRILRKLCTGRVNLNDQEPLFCRKNPHSLQSRCYGWCTLCFGWSTWCWHGYGVFFTFGSWYIAKRQEDFVYKNSQLSLKKAIHFCVLYAKKYASLKSTQPRGLVVVTKMGYLCLSMHMMIII